MEAALALGTGAGYLATWNWESGSCKQRHYTLLEDVDASRMGTREGGREVVDVPAPVGPCTQQDNNAVKEKKARPRVHEQEGQQGANVTHEQHAIRTSTSKRMATRLNSEASDTDPRQGSDAPFYRDTNPSKRTRVHV